MTEPRVCVPKSLPAALAGTAPLFAHAANPDNVPLFDLRALPAAQPLEIASITSKRWKPGADLPVGFFGGSTALQMRVLRAMRRWSEVCNIDFHPVADLSKAVQRWAFTPGAGSWNYLGTDVLSIPVNQPTGNLGWLTEATDEAEFRRVVVHETGHLLSFGHEAQLGEALGQLKFNTAKVYAYFCGPPNNWSVEEVNQQILTPMSLAGVEHSDFDKRSIMEYWFDASWIVPPTEIPNSTDLSPTDIAKGRDWYGSRGTPAVATAPDFPPPDPKDPLLSVWVGNVRLQHAVNAARSSALKSPLAFDGALAVGARRWAEACAKSGRLAHDDMAARYAAVGWPSAAEVDFWASPWPTAGLAPDAAKVTAGWWSSAGHRLPLLGGDKWPEWTHCGFGWAYDAKGSLYVIGAVGRRQ